MIYLVLCIFSSSLILLLFKFIERKGIDAFQTIVINYLIAGLLGLIVSFANNQQFSSFPISSLPYAMLIGLLFIIVFFQIAQSTRYAGISTTTVATKMSVVIPILFSITRYHEILDWLKVCGIGVALIALFLTVYKKGGDKLNRKAWIYPIIIFFGTGIVDTAVKFSQAEHILPGGLSIFNTIVFGTSFLIGVSIFLFSWKEQIRKFKPSVLLYGSFLGIVNFGSLFFLISALDQSGLNSSVVFPLNNIGVVVISVLAAMLFFKEKVSALNLTGVLVAIFAVILLLGN